MKKIDVSKKARHRHTSRQGRPLQPHQEDALKAILKEFKTANRTTVVMACGTGKTDLEWEVPRRLDAGKVVVFVPSLRLMDQTITSWRENAPPNYRFLCVCSLNELGQKSDEEDEKEEIPDLSDVDITTDPDEVRRFLRRPEPMVVFSTYHSSEVLKGLSFDVGIFDEAHWTTGNLTKNASFALSDKNVKISKRLFMTATPRVAKDDNEDGGCYSMSLDRKAGQKNYGKLAYELPFKRAVERGLLTDYRIIIYAVPKADVAMMMRDNVALQVIEKEGHAKLRIDPNLVAAAVVLHKTKKKHKWTHALAFTSTVARSAALAGFVKMVSGKESWYVSSETTKTDREKGLKKWTKNGGVMSNCRIFAEGIDKKFIDLAMFVDPKDSTIDTIQAVGRTMRLNAGKKIAYVVVPIVVNVDHDGELSDDEIEGAVNESSFRKIGRIVDALRNIDESLVETFAGTSYPGRSNKRRGRTTKPDVEECKVIFEGFDGVFEDIKKHVKARIMKRLGLGSASVRAKAEECLKFWDEHHRWPKWDEELYKSIDGLRNGHNLIANDLKVLFLERDASFFRNQKMANIDKAASVCWQSWDKYGKWPSKYRWMITHVRSGQVATPNIVAGFVSRDPQFFMNQKVRVSSDNAKKSLAIFDATGLWPTSRQKYGTKLVSFMHRLKSNKTALPADIAKQFHKRGLKMVKVLKE